MTWKPKGEASEGEKYTANIQRAEAQGCTCKVSCGGDDCSAVLPFHNSYRCFYCKISFCAPCAEKHFERESHG